MDQIKNIADLMHQIHLDTEAVKSGELDVEKGRIVMRGRTQQVKLAEVFVQAQRITRRGGGEFLLTAGKDDAPEIAPATAPAA